MKLFTGEFIRMKKISLVILAFIAVVAFGEASRAAEPDLYWYEIGITREKTAAFTGSSTLDPSQLADRLCGTEPIVLENLRSVFAGGKGNLPMGWHADDDTLRVVIPIVSVVYIKQLPGDPASPR